MIVVILRKPVVIREAYTVLAYRFKFDLGQLFLGLYAADLSRHRTTRKHGPDDGRYLGLRRLCCGRNDKSTHTALVN